MVNVCNLKPDFDAVKVMASGGGAKAMVVLEVLALFVIFKTVAELVKAQRMPKMLFGADMRPMAL